ncbi:MAG: hypothetical protein GY750_14080 [Lentisphaerae bacterium]|nr:hypothetical protein [Lentisphaerota bacterium]
MAVSNEINRVEYDCDGSQQVFSFGFRIFTNSDIEVYVRDVSSETKLPLNSGYTVTPAGTDFINGGSITTTVAYSAGNKIVIIRTLPLTSEFNLAEAGELSSTALVAAIDRNVMISQQLNSKIKNVIQAPATESTPQVLPPQVERAGKFLFFSNDGSITAQGIAEQGAISVDEQTIQLTGSTLSIKNSGVTAAKLNNNVNEHITSLADSAIGVHAVAVNPHPVYTTGDDFSAHTNNLDVHRSNPNLLINGGFQVWQRGESFINVVTNTYTADRWVFNDNNTTSRANITKNEQSNLIFEIANSGSAVLSVLDQRIDILGKKQSSQFTFSTMLKKSSGTSGSLTMYDEIGAPFVSESISDSDEFQTISITGTLPENKSTVNCRFQINNPQNGQSLEIVWAKLEVGNIATPFEYSNYTTEALKCHRYYWDRDSFSYLYDAKKSTTNSGPTGTSILFPTEMRATPTVTLKNPSGNFSVQSVTKHGFEVRGNSWGQCSFNGFTASAEI